MRFQVEREPFADAVAWTARSLPARPAMPVLAGLLLETGPEGLVVSGFDYEVSTQADVACTVAEEGRALVSGRLLAEITRSLPAQPVDVVTEGSRLTVTCGSTRFTLPTMPAEDYPTLPDLPATAGSVGSDEFAAAVSSVAVAAGRDDTLPVLTGVRVEIDGDRMTMVATDRYRLAVRELRWRPEAGLPAAVALVPARTLAEVAKSMTSAAEVTVALASGGRGDGMVGFVGGRRRATTRLLDGEFPKYRTLLPSESAAEAVVDAAAMIESVKRVALVAQRTAPVRLSFGADEVVLEAGGTDDAQASESLAVIYTGEPMTIAFNPGYLLDALGSTDSDQVRMAFTSPVRPAVVTSKDVSGDYRHLLMPVRLSG